MKNVIQNLYLNAIIMVVFLIDKKNKICESQFINCADLACDEMQHRDASSTVYLSLSII